MTEYIILVTVIAILSIAVVAAFGNQLRGTYWEAAHEMSQPDGEVAVQNRMGDREEMVNRQLGAQ